MKKYLLSGLAVMALVVSGAMVTGCSNKTGGVSQPAGGPKPITTAPPTGATGETTEAPPGPSVETPTLPD